MRLKLKRSSKFHFFRIINEQKGFSLLEVLIAIVILSFLMLSIYQIIDNSSASNYRIQNEDRALLQFESALNIIQTDFEYMYSPLFFETDRKTDLAAYKKVFKTSAPGSSSSRNNDDVYNDGNQGTLSDIYLGYSASNLPIPRFINENKTSIAFLTSAGRRLVKDTKQSNLFWVVYELRDNPEPDNQEAPYVLTRATLRENIYDPNVDLKSLKPYAILDNVKSLEFKFWNRERRAFVDASRLLNEDENLPRMIRIDIQTESPTGDIIESKRTFRPLFPIVDTKELLKRKYTKTAANGGVTGGLSGGGQGTGGLPQGEDGEQGGFE